jgi:tetratricopeptide (TPR) repeat protein
VGDLRIFISAVTSEFGKARDQVASDLRARGHSVSIQSDFQQRPDGETLLATLADYTHDCHAVICIVGHRSGACPPKAAAERLGHTLPPGIKEASYTQWEFFFARHFMRRPFVYIANDDYAPDLPISPDDRTELQTSFRDRLKADGVHYTSFSNADQLSRAILRDEPKIAAEPPPKQASIKPIVLPYPSIGDLFKGRHEFIERLHNSLSQGNRTAITSQAVYGLGGVGKTRTAVEYAWAHADDYCALLFVVGETPQALRRNIAALTIMLVPTLDTTDNEARLMAVLDWFKSNPGWLLILDNVDTRDAMAEVEQLLGRLACGHVVITSRLSNFSAHVEPLELDVLTTDAAVAFLLERTKGRRRAGADDESMARELAGELGGLALMLEQAGAYIAKHRLTFGQYLDQWRSNRDKVLDWYDHTITGYERRIATTWQTSVAQLTKPGRRLLERLAWLAPEKVPEFLLDVPVRGAEAKNVRDALDDLATYSLATRDAEGPYFLIHRVVQDLTRRSLVGETKAPRLMEALEWINAAFIGSAVDVRNWPRLDPLVPHARAVTGHADAAGIAETTSGLMNQLALLLGAKALHMEAEPLMRRALAIDERTYHPLDPAVSTRLNNLGELLYQTNRVAEAEPLMRRALAIDENAYGLNHPIVAIRLNNLAQLLRQTNRLSEAEPLMHRALAINEAVLGTDHPNVATDLNNLAGLLRATKRFSEAELLYRRAVLIDEKNYGPKHPEVAMDLSNLAVLLQDTNRVAEAESLIRRALAIDEEAFGPDHPTVAVRLNNLAGVLLVTKRIAEAEPLMHRALAIDEMAFGLDHPNVAVRLNNLALLLKTTNRSREGEPLMRRVVGILVEYTRRTGHSHPHLDLAFENYSALLQAVGKSKAQIKAALNELKRPLA